MTRRLCEPQHVSVTKRLHLHISYLCYIFFWRNTAAYATTKATTSGNDLSDSDDEDFPPGPISSAYDEPEDHKFVPMRSHFSYVC